MNIVFYNYYSKQINDESINTNHWLRDVRKKSFYPAGEVIFLLPPFLLKLFPGFSAFHQMRPCSYLIQNLACCHGLPPCPVAQLVLRCTENISLKNMVIYLILSQNKYTLYVCIFFQITFLKVYSTCPFLLMFCCSQCSIQGDFFYHRRNIIVIRLGICKKQSMT